MGGSGIVRPARTGAAGSRHFGGVDGGIGQSGKGEKKNPAGDQTQPGEWGLDLGIAVRARV